MDTTARRRSPVPLWIGSALLLALAGISLGIYLRGTRVDVAPVDPARVEDGVRCRLLEPAGEHRRVRCALLLDAPPAAAWAVVTDYAHFTQIFAASLWSLRVDRVTRNPDGNVHLQGAVSNWLTRFPMDAVIHHELSPGRDVASWDERSDGFVLRNRGSWTITPAGARQSLLVYELAVEVKEVPDFLINCVLLDDLGPMLIDVRDRLRANPPART